MNDTIFALSSGAPPAAIGVIRISGSAAGNALLALAGALPPPRRAVLRVLRDGDGGLLDRALVLWLPGPDSATGEDMAELHCHGGRAVVAAIERALAALPQLRRATSGEFTRRAFSNGRIDLAEAEGLADLLCAETELQRRSALAMAEGFFSRHVNGWRDEVLALSAAVEAVLDFADEDDVGGLPDTFAVQLGALRDVMEDWLARPRAEALKEGFRVTLAGPPNSGKSTLFNALVEDDAAIVTPLAGTTRDVLTRPVALGGVPFLFVDTAGLREGAGDAVESLGIERARRAMGEGDLVLWLGPEGEGPADAWEVAARCDCDDAVPKVAPRHRVSAVSGEGLDGLRHGLILAAQQALPVPGMAALNARQYGLLEAARDSLDAAAGHADPLLVAEGLRQARVAFDALLGRTTTEDMLDALFGRFCIGK